MTAKVIVEVAPETDTDLGEYELSAHGGSCRPFRGLGYRGQCWYP
ncbi:hypothetical protein STANM309S_02121 [Streptomyces tanashiensis]